jgi:diguanylate cyclase
VGRRQESMRDPDRSLRAGQGYLPRKKAVFEEFHTVFLVLPCTVLIFVIGYYLGFSRIKQERKILLRALSEILQTTDDLSQDIDSRNTKLADMEREVQDLDVPNEMQKMHQLLLEHIKGVISSNKKLEEDLTCTRYTLEQQARELDRTRVLALTDELSQVGNRRAFDEAMDYWLLQWKRQGDRFALVLIDLDHFKWINDTHGHQAGDRVVRGVGNFLKQNLRAADFIARYGGDEFAVLLKSEQREDTVKIAESLCDGIQTRDFSAVGHGERIAITFSMGLAFVREREDANRLIERTDALLYQAKLAGRNCLRVEADQFGQEQLEETLTL